MAHDLAAELVLLERLTEAQWFESISDFGSAAESYRLARRCMSPSALPCEADEVVMHAQLVAAQASSLFELNRSVELADELALALRNVETIEFAHSSRAEAIAALNLELARICRMRGQLPQARELLESALGALAPEPTKGSAALLRARIQANMGAIVAMLGDVSGALPYLLAALTLHEAMPHLQPAIARGRLLMNIGNACNSLRRSREGLRYLMRARPLMEVDARTLSIRDGTEFARLLRNIGVALSDSRRLHEAIDCFGESAARYDRLIARSERALAAARRMDMPAEDLAKLDRAHAPLKASRASTLMNHGHALYRAGRLDQARNVLRRSLREYAKLVRTQPALRDDCARAWVNQGHLDAVLGNLKRATEFYVRGISGFAELIEEGDVHLEPLRANANLALARVELGRGMVRLANERFVPAMHALAQLTRQGHLQHAGNWLESWQQYFSSAFDPAPGQVAQGDMSSKHLHAVRAALMQALDHPPWRGTGGGQEHFGLLNDATSLAAHWWRRLAMKHASASLAVPVLGKYVSYLLDMSADVLADSEPRWLRLNSAKVSKLVGTLQRLTAALPQSSSKLVVWFLRTHGLRAQRNAMTTSDDPQVVALAGMLRQLRDVEHELS